MNGQIVYTAPSERSRRRRKGDVHLSDRGRIRRPLGAGHRYIDPRRGPVAKSGAVTVGHSETNVNLTSLVKSLFSPGAAGDGTAITSLAGASLVNGQVLYTPPASGSPNFSYTVTDSLGQTATNTVDVTVDPGPSVTSAPPTFVKEGAAVAVGAASPGISGDTLTLVNSGGSDKAPTYGSLSLSRMARLSIRQRIAFPRGAKTTRSAIRSRTNTATSRRRSRIR